MKEEGKRRRGEERERIWGWVDFCPRNKGR
jgi:hypothetical protein